MLSFRRTRRAQITHKLYLRLMLVAICYCLRSRLVSAIALPRAHGSNHKTLQTSTQLKYSGRRDFLHASCAGIMAASFFGSPAPVYAIKERNEALCGTGFFTNIWQYKCTDLGDISDEGETKALSSGEEQATNSLLSKLWSMDQSDSTKSEEETKIESGSSRKPFASPSLK